MKKPPEGLVSTRPALEGEDIPHPENGDPLGKPPARYTQGVHDRIVELIKKRNRPQVAAATCGIPQSTYYAWMRMGREGNPHLVQFVEDVEQALAEAEVGAVEVLTGTGDGFINDADSAKWWLERQRTDGYSKEAATKVNAMLADFFERLERALPPPIFQMVVAAAQGQALTQAKPVFQLSEKEEDDDESPGQDS